jgi:zinc transporter, ZIP family
MNTESTPSQKTEKNSKRLGWKTIGLIALPVAALVIVIGTFLATNGAGLHIHSIVPVESVTFEKIVLHPGLIEFTIQNNSPEPITISAININDAIWPFKIVPSGTIPRLGQATIQLTYHWVEGEAYAIDLFTANSISFSAGIDAAAETVPPNTKTLLSYLLIGLYVGVIPVFLGMIWMPVLRLLGPRWMMFLMAITAGLLIFLGIDAANEGLELARDIGNPFQGVGLVGIGIVVTFLLLEALGRRQAMIGRSDIEQRSSLAFMIALGIGLHNLGEGLAIGASFSQGALALGTFLVIGFIIQNITEGLGIIIPVLKDAPPLGKLALLGLIGGGPAILGGLVGGLLYSKVLAVLFLAIGAGAVFEVVYEVAKLIQKDAAKQPKPMIVFAGITTGMFLLYGLGLIIK